MGLSPPGGIEGAPVNKSSYNDSNSGPPPRGKRADLVEIRN